MLYKPVKPITKKEPFKQYLSAVPTRIFRIKGTVTVTANLYIDHLRILTNRIKEFNAKFIRDKPGFRFVGVLQFILKMVKYAPIEGRGWQAVPNILTKKGHN